MKLQSKKVQYYCVLDETGNCSGIQIKYENNINVLLLNILCVSSSLAVPF